MKLVLALGITVLLTFFAVSTTAIFNIHSDTDWSFCDPILANEHYTPPTYEQYNEWKQTQSQSYHGTYALFAENAGKFVCKAAQYLEKQQSTSTVFFTQLQSLFKTFSLKQYNSQTTFSFFLSPFAATSPSEFKQRLGNKGMSSHQEYRRVSGADRYLRLEDLDQNIARNLPESFDWRDYPGVVSPIVSDQGPFGTCWSFSAVAAMEGQITKVGLDSTQLSMQTSVECDNYTSNVYFADCGYFGGLPSMAMKYNRDHGGYRTLNDYPYSYNQQTDKVEYRPCMSKGYDKKLCGNHDDLYCKPEDTKGQCTTCAEPLCNPNNGKFYATVDQIYDIEANDTAIMTALMQFGPLSFAAHADEWSYAAGGILDFDCDTFMDHAILLVGWGYSEEEKKPFWYMKNSWGEKWNPKEPSGGGYMRIVRGKNMCGMNNQVVAVTAKKV